MTEAEVLEAIQNYASQSGFEMLPAEENVIPMKFLPNPKLQLALKYELTGGGGVDNVRVVAGRDPGYPRLRWVVTHRKISRHIILFRGKDDGQAPLPIWRDFRTSKK